MLQILFHVGIVILGYIAIALILSVVWWGWDYRSYKKTGQRDHKFPVDVSWQSYSVYLAISAIWFIIVCVVVVDKFNSLKRK